LGLKVNRDSIKEICSKRSEKSPEKCRVNPNQFLSVTTPEIAYLLGLLWADGHVKSINLSGSIRFGNITSDIDDIRHVFHKTGDWNFYEMGRQRANWKDQTAIVINEKTLFNFLKDHDYETKSGGSPIKILSHVPEHLRHYWWRGYFDGDGNLYIGKHCHQISMASTYDQDWSFALSLMATLGVKGSICQTISKKGHKSSTLRICGIENCKRFCEFIYAGYELDKIGFSRKYQKYQQLSKLKAKNDRVSKYPGVRLRRKDGKWIALITKNNVNGFSKHLFLGSFDSAEEAREARERHIKTHQIPQYVQKTAFHYDTSSQEDPSRK
jgi:hypothetical protein